MINVQQALEALTTSGNLDDETLARVEHISRYLERVAEMVPAGMQVGEAVTRDQLQVIWLETAEGA
jgi:hypothetical protein